MCIRVKTCSLSSSICALLASRINERLLGFGAQHENKQLEIRQPRGCCGMGRVCEMPTQLDKSSQGRVGDFDTAPKRKPLLHGDESESPRSSALICTGGNGGGVERGVFCMGL